MMKANTVLNICYSIQFHKNKVSKTITRLRKYKPIPGPQLRFHKHVNDYKQNKHADRHKMPRLIFLLFFLLTGYDKYRRSRVMNIVILEAIASLL